MRDYSQAFSEKWGDVITYSVEIITGQPARSFDQFAREVFAPALRQGGLGGRTVAVDSHTMGVQWRRNDTGRTCC